MIVRWPLTVFAMTGVERFGVPGRVAILLGALVAAANGQESTAPAPEFYFSTESSTGYKSNRWSEFRMTAANMTDEGVELLATSYLNDNANLQFGRTFWLPANSQLRFTQPFLVPDLPPGEESLALRTLISPAGEPSKLIRHNFDSLQGDLLFRIDRDERLNGVIDDNPNGEPGHVRVIDMLMTARLDANLRRIPVFLSARRLAARQESYGAFDGLTLASNAVADDGPGLAALRAWLFAGGHLWIMLDRVDDSVLQHLLGDGFECPVVDRVGLNEILFESGSASHLVTDTPVQHDLPVEHVRVFGDGFDVIYRVNGWPAAMTKRCGRGELLVTTLAADGWVLPLTASDARGVHAGYSVSMPLKALSGMFFTPRTPPLMERAATEEYVKGQVGYSIPSRGMVLGALLGFTLFVGAAGVVLARNGRLEWMGLAVPVAAGVTGGILIVAGYRHQNAIADRTAVVQLVQPMADAAQIRGSAAMFLPHAEAVQIHGVHDGWGTPDATGQSGTARRLTWSGLNEWSWQEERASPSLKFVETLANVPLKTPVGASLTLNERGFSGAVHLPDGLVPSDGVLVGPSGRMAVDFQSDLSWTSTPDQLLADTEMLGADVLTDEQARRLHLLQTAFARPSQNPFSQNSLLVWTAPWETGIRFSESAPVEGAALVVLPVELTAPAGGEPYVIPSAWLPYREQIGPDGERPNGLFNNLQGAWSEKATPTTTWIRFQIPEGLAPWQLDEGHLTVQVSGPVGKLQIDGFDGGQRVSIREWIDPIGTLTTEIKPPLLNVDEKGGLFLHLAAGDPARPELTRSLETGVNVSYWRIESLTLELRGRMPKTPDPAASAQVSN